MRGEQQQKWQVSNLTLTSVVFESRVKYRARNTSRDLTLTSVVFE